MLGVLLAEANSKSIQAIVEQCLVQRALLHLLLQSSQLFLDLFELLLPAHIIDHFVVLVVARLYLRLHFLALVVVLLHILNQLAQLARQLLLLLRDFSELRDCLLILLIDPYLVLPYKRQVVLQFLR